MKNEQSDSNAPLCAFFQIPQDMLKKEGIASALQSFETTIMLIGYGRWPSIIPLLWGACEALLRVKYPDKSQEISVIQIRFNTENHISQALAENVHKLRRLRNEIAHQGYMPRDTPRCIDLFFNAGLPYFDLLLKNITGHRLLDSLYPKGSDQIWDIFQKTRKALTSKMNKSSASTEDALLFLILKVRQTFSPTFIPQALWDIQDTQQDHVWDSEMLLRKKMISWIEKEHGYCFDLSGVLCPVCGSDVLASFTWKGSDPKWQLDRLNPVGCFRCQYLTNDQDLIKVFFQSQLTTDLIAELESDKPPLAQPISV